MLKDYVQRELQDILGSLPGRAILEKTGLTCNPQLKNSAGVCLTLFCLIGVMQNQT